MYEFTQTTQIQQPIDTVFDFFSKAENLETITPPFVGFKILTPTPIEMQQGTLIDYRIKLHGIPMKWRTLISKWDPPHQFVDEQIKGPYQTWIHSHTFEPGPDETSTIMRDHVKYSMLAGKLVHFLVKKDIEKIFAYRTQVIESRFKP